MDLKCLKPNAGRGLIGLFAYAAICFGAGSQWGFGAGLFALGFVVWVDASSDEALERITGIERADD